MVLRVAVQMDPISGIKPATDTSFALLLEAQKRGFSLYYYTPEQLSLVQGEVVCPLATLQVQDLPGQHFTLGETRRTSLRTMDVILMRQDPPFDLAYITATHLLEQLHPRPLVINNPHHVRNAPEKLFVTQFGALMPPTLITRSKEEIAQFRTEHGAVVMKPLFGHGGADVFLLEENDSNFEALYGLFARIFREPWVVQRFLPEIAQGDKRIVLVDGEIAGALNRIPQGVNIRSNLACGGQAVATSLTEREEEICKILGPELRARGLLLAGIDVIGGFLTEINVTSPTGLRTIAQLNGPNIASHLWDKILAKIDSL